MRSSFFRRIAWNNIKKNYRFFVPRILAETGLSACLYIAVTLSMDERIGEVEGGAYVTSFMVIGSLILGMLSLILMIYANSFLMKQRKHEYGLYNVLGMEKRHVGRVLFHESLISSVISVALGLCMGMLFYKLCALVIIKILGAEIALGLYFIKLPALLVSAAFFLATDLVIFLSGRLSLRRLKPVELLKSRSAGEKEPRVKWVLLILGAICLCAGYGLSLSVKSAISALALFFVAVFLVIFGTYFLFIAGSIFVLKALKKKKDYYYKSRHFVTISGLMYRMKQNAAGLASIAILATGVLVMISTTVSLYSSLEDSVALHYPQQVYVQGGYYADDRYTEIPAEELLNIARVASEGLGLEISETQTQEYIDLMLPGKVPELGLATNQMDDVTDLIIITGEVYEGLTGETLALGANEIAVCPLSGTDPIRDDHISIKGTELVLTRKLDVFPISAPLFSAGDRYGVVVRDGEVIRSIVNVREGINDDTYQTFEAKYTERIAVAYEDVLLYREKDNELRAAIFDGMNAYVRNASGDDRCILSAYVDTMMYARSELVGMYGAFLFLGIIMGIVCLFATALIMYYKQISEGYEDRDRFQIMKKVGMSDSEIRGSIRPQLLLVFFLPLAAAASHMCFAFPMLEKMLHLLMLSNTKVFVVCALIVFFAFALVYVIIYSVTARSYYKIIR